MPIKLQKNDRSGDYSIRLLKPEVRGLVTATNQDGTSVELPSITHQTIPMFGQTLSQFQLFRRLGNLPDNNILANKLINSLGKTY